MEQPVITKSIETSCWLQPPQQIMKRCRNRANHAPWAALEQAQESGKPLQGRPSFPQLSLERAVELDPLSGINNGQLGLTYLALGRREEGREYIEKGLELGWVNPAPRLLYDYLHTGEKDKASEFILSSIERWDYPDEIDEMLTDVWLRVIEGTITGDELLEIYQRAEGDGDERLFEVLESAFLPVDDLDRHFDLWALREDFHLVYNNRSVFIPSGRELAEHPRFLGIAERAGLFPVWEAKGYPMGCDMVEDEQGRHLSCPNWPE